VLALAIDLDVGDAADHDDDLLGAVGSSREGAARIDLEQ
jgi:hypothetical protein